MSKALAMVEYLTVATGITAADLMVKTADVELIEARAEARRDLRVQAGTYQLAATGKNVEDYYMREELRKKGCDILAWEKGVKMDAEGNVSFAAWDGGRRK